MLTMPSFADDRDNEQKRDRPATTREDRLGDEVRERDVQRGSHGPAVQEHEFVGRLQIPPIRRRRAQHSSNRGDDR
jgi:hypothetical protein